MHQNDICLSIYNTGNVPGDDAGIIYKEKNIFFIVYLPCKGSFPGNRVFFGGFNAIKKMGLGFFGGGLSVLKLSILRNE